MPQSLSADATPLELAAILRIPQGSSCLATLGFEAKSFQDFKSLSENWVGSCGEGFWLWPRRRDRRIPKVPTGRDNGRANAGQSQKSRRRTPSNFQTGS